MSFIYINFFYFVSKNILLLNNAFYKLNRNILINYAIFNFFILNFLIQKEKKLAYYYANKHSFLFSTKNHLLKVRNNSLKMIYFKPNKRIYKK